eukprot:TRINITY_DN30514_c0_g1_i1.p1 TRINITY_DN30514_c0_g1~~TRINITY_DN30514_c0_g1_i1.p1  ORF type:complete len:470 (-),score=68.16 TRINITY_DN30514_c0_g1_i1:352-1761(-)
MSGYNASTPSVVAAKEDIHLLNCTFNQTNCCFVCGTTEGFRTFTVLPLQENNRQEKPGLRNVVLLSMLFRSNLYALVMDDPKANRNLNKVFIWDQKLQKVRGEVRTRTEVTGVLMRRDIIVAICEHTSYVYALHNLQIVMTLETISNPRGLGVLLPEGNPWMFVHPVKPLGHVGIQVGDSQDGFRSFKAHESGITVMALSRQGQILATASERGTVIKVFKTVDGQQLYRFRRGANGVAISCLSFASATAWPDAERSYMGANEDYLAVASSSHTVHIFKLDLEAAMREAAPNDEGAVETSKDSRDAEAEDDEEPTAEVDGKQPEGSIIRQAVTTVASGAESIGWIASNVVPTFLSDLRSFAQFILPDRESNGQFAVDTRHHSDARIQGPKLAFHGKEPRLFALCHNGVMYECSFKPDHDPSSGTQDCKFVSATTWFAVRPDFQVQGATKTVTAAGEDGDDDDGGDEYLLV